MSKLQQQWEGQRGSLAQQRVPGGSTQYSTQQLGGTPGTLNPGAGWLSAVPLSGRTARQGQPGHEHGLHLRWSSPRVVGSSQDSDIFNRAFFQEERFWSHCWDKDVWWQESEFSGLWHQHQRGDGLGGTVQAWMSGLTERYSQRWLSC